VIEGQLADVIALQDTRPVIPLGQCRFGDKPSVRTLRVTRGTHPMQWDTLQCRTSTDSIDARLERIDPNTWDLELAVKDVGRLGYVRDRLEFLFLRGRDILPYSLTKRVEAQLLGPVQAEPSALLFGAVPFGETVRKTLRLTNTLDEHARVQVVSINPSDPNHVDAESVSNGVAHSEISVAFSADNEEGCYEGIVAIEVELDRRYELRVAYTAIVTNSRRAGP